MPRQTIHAKVYNRILGLSGPGPIYTCTKLVVTERRDGAGEFRAEFPASDTRLDLIAIKETYLQFEVGGAFFFLGLVERMYTELNDQGKQTVVVMGRDQLGALAENTVGDLSIEFAYDAPAQIVDAADVPNQNFSLSAEGNSVTNTPYTRLFAGESALSALSKVAADLGEHFRTPKSRLLEVVWMGTATPTAPVRLVSSGGPRLHENPDVAVIEHVARDHNAEQLANRIYPYGAGIGAARLTLEHATTSMPTGYTMDTASNYIQNDAQQSLPSVRKAIQKTWNHIGVDVGQVYPIQVDTTALTGATTIIVESIAMPIASGTLLDLNGGGVDFVELSANVSVGANVLNVVATTFDVLDTDTLVYTNPDALEAASRQLAYAALTYLQRVSDPARMVAYKLTVRGLPDTVTVGMTIPVLSQAPGFNIDDDLIILEITRTVTRQGQMPAVVRVVPVDWFDQGEASSIAATMEEFRVSQAQAQPVAYATIEGVPGFVETVNGIAGPDPVLDPDDLDDSATTNKFTTAGDISKLAGIEALADVTDATNIASSITGVSTDDTIVDADVWGYLTSGALVKTTWSNIKAVLKTYFDTLYNLYVHPNHSGDVTSVADGAQTIAADAVTNAKAANMAADTIKGRANGAGTGDPTDLTATQVRTIINVADGANAYVHPNHSGDVTSVADGAQTIASDAVTNAKLNNMATQTIKGRTTAGTGDPEDLTAAQAAAIVNASIDHGTTSGKSDDDHTQYALLAGRSGGQTLYGGTAASNALTLYTTSNATKGVMNLADVLYVNEVNDRVGIGTATPSYDLHMITDDGGAAMLIDASATAYNATSGILIIQDDSDRQCAFSSIGLFRRDADVDNAAFAINFQGYNGGTTRYRDLNVFNGKNTSVMFVDGSANAVGLAGVTAPQGPLHIHDGTGGMLFVTKTAINGTAQTIIPNGTGDVTNQLYVQGMILGSGGHKLAVWDWIDNGGSRTLGTTDAVTIAVNANGTVTIQRTAGSQTWTANLLMQWV